MLKAAKNILEGFVNRELQATTMACREAVRLEKEKTPLRYDIINWFISQSNPKRYLEIGVRNLDDCFNRIQTDTKLSVDPGFEVEVNLADIPLTSDQFFDSLRKGELNVPFSKFDVIFIDGLHTAEQTYRDIVNSLEFVSDSGCILLHDCNPPTRFHAREDYAESGPAGRHWNGTTWKAIQRFRTDHDNECHVIDTDWGVGVIHCGTQVTERLSSEINPFYEFAVLEANRKKILNLVDFEKAKELYLSIAKDN